MSNNPILITSYECPDLDGVACTFAYTEFLQQQKQNVIAALSWSLQREAEFVLETFHIPSLQDAEPLIATVDQIIILDASDTGVLSKTIPAEKVIEVIDHRKVHEAHTQFPNAKVQVELVGSAATLIAEKFHQEQLAPSQEAAALLYSAIISNTVNFQASVTTSRDHTMANRLKTQFTLPDHYIHDMFVDKSHFRKSLKQTVIDDFATFNLHNHTLGIAQLEIVNVDAFIEKNRDELQAILEELKKEQGLEYIFLTCIDLEKAFNKLLVIDEPTKDILEEALQVNFENEITQREGILMRKELVPRIKDVIKNMLT